VSIKEHISRGLWNSNIFDFCRFVAYCGTKEKNRGYVTSLMTGSLLFTIQAIKRFREAAIHTPTFRGCNWVSTNACVFYELHIL
jgi:hypothetical protein